MGRERSAVRTVGAVMTAGSPLTVIRSSLAQLSTTEARLGVTATLVVVAVGIALLFAPWVVRRIARELDERVLSNSRVPDLVSDARWILPPSVIVRMLQAAIFLSTGLAILVVWGREDLAVTIVALLVSLTPVAGKVLMTAGLFVGAYVGIDALESWLTSYAAESDQINEHQEGIVFRVLQLVMLTAVTLATLAVWDAEVGNLLVGAGFLGIVVGMAARQTLGSFIAGFVLMFSRPFEIGDWVEIDGEEGIVSDVTIINTRLRNFDGETVVFPNDRVTNATITNRTRRDQLRLSVDVGVDYETDLDVAVGVAEAALEDVDVVADVPAPNVLPTTFGDSAVGLKVRFWIKHPSAPRRAKANAAVVRAIKAAFDGRGIKIPYPQRELQSREETSGFVVRSGDTENQETPKTVSTSE
ncbi:small-conductance mechanosensitive channel [Halogeometricum borinquense DSM 11551]|uniref:Small-conductance mechanosensitive channel n=2 Tax=Halogeometricum borinquense (strain ATCC 700274 / DSM 11551 / JCM 10706 / KCTC 4070 / PR3) TaxID=469382 RepID=L9UYR0_HALBP|nr:small-conductance mechanosensitive channel [Halogeometricum borinquense DSM 11551]